MDNIKQFIDDSKVAGWVRAVVAAIIAVALAKWPTLASYLSAEVQAAISVLISGVLVGVWSQATKTEEAKIKAVEALPSVAKIVPALSAPVDSAIVKAEKDPERPKIYG